MTLTVSAPQGAHFEFDEVRTAKGTQSLGDKPLLVWDDLEAARATYGDDGIKSIMDGTSLRVSFQSLSRRLAIAGKSDDEIAQAQVSFRPGNRSGGASTPVSRARNAAAKAAETLGDKSDVLTALLEKINRGELSLDDVEAMAN